VGFYLWKTTQKWLRKTTKKKAELVNLGKPDVYYQTLKKWLIEKQSD